MSIKAVLCGPPRSGKSCLRQGLKDAISRISGAPYCYAITACPDGEGGWFQEAMRQDPLLAAKLKASYKRGFTPEFVRLASEWVTNCALPLTLVDIGGVPDEKNEIICSRATHAILLAPDPGGFDEWRDFSARVGLSVVAEIHSHYTGHADDVRWDGRTGLLTGSIHRLERGEAVLDRPMVRSLAELLVRMATNPEPGLGPARDEGTPGS